MLKQIITLISIVTSTKLSYKESLKTLHMDLSSSTSNSCNLCKIDVCGEEIMNIPTDINCEEVNFIFNTIKELTFTKPTSYCPINGNKYICNVYVKPLSTIIEPACFGKEIELDKNVEKNSFCNANKYCPLLAECSEIYNINCEKDSEVLPYLDITNNTFTTNECPKKSLKEKIKKFTQDYGKNIAISVIIDGILIILVIIILMCCYIKKNKVNNNINDIES